MCVLCAFFSTPPLCARAHKGDLFFRCTKRTGHIVNMNNLQYLRTNYLRNIVILQRNQYVSRISSDWELCGMCVFTLISSFVLKIRSSEPLRRKGFKDLKMCASKISSQRENAQSAHLKIAQKSWNCWIFAPKKESPSEPEGPEGGKETKYQNSVRHRQRGMRCGAL